jgi:hypothetical protein
MCVSAELSHLRAFGLTTPPADETLGDAPAMPGASAARTAFWGMHTPTRVASPPTHMCQPLKHACCARSLADRDAPALGRTPFEAPPLRLEDPTAGGDARRRLLRRILRRLDDADEPTLELVNQGLIALTQWQEASKGREPGRPPAAAPSSAEVLPRGAQQRNLVRGRTRRRRSWTRRWMATRRGWT